MTAGLLIHVSEILRIISAMFYVISHCFYRLFIAGEKVPNMRVEQERWHS